MSWSRSLCTYVWIFSVGRGNAAFLRSGLNQGFIFDMGTGSDDFDPAQFVKDHIAAKLDHYQSRRVAQAVLSHPHADHIVQCDELSGGKDLWPVLLTCPHDNDPPDGCPDEKLDWSRILDPEGSNAEVIQTYRSLYEKRNPPLQTILFESSRTVPNLEYGIYYVRPPVCDELHPADDNKYGNATSIVLYFRHGDHSVLVPGDVTPEAMKTILDEEEGLEKRYTVFDSRSSIARPHWHERTSDQPRLRDLLRSRGLSILIAPHHGLESCYSEDLYHAIRGGKPKLVVISERRHKKKGDGKLDHRYQSEAGASGLEVVIDGTPQHRRSVSTVQGHHILLVFSGTGRPRVFAHRDPRQLLDSESLARARAR